MDEGGLLDLVKEIVTDEGARLSAPASLQSWREISVRILFLTGLQSQLEGRQNFVVRGEWSGNDLVIEWVRRSEGWFLAEGDDVVFQVKRCSRKCRKALLDAMDVPWLRGTLFGTHNKLGLFLLKLRSLMGRRSKR